MAKKKTKALAELRSKHGLNRGTGGIGYFIPPSARNEWKQLYKTWSKKLQDSGFPEIEQFSTDCTGHFSPYFIKTAQNKSISGSSATVLRQYKPENAIYYRQLSIFFYHAPYKRLFGPNASLYYHIIKLRKDGATYKDIVACFNSARCPATVKKLKPRFTIFFVWYHLQIIEPAINQWFKDNPKFY